MPRSGHMANQHAKVCASAVVALLTGGEVNPAPVVTSTCYSYLSEREVAHIASVHRYDAATRTMNVVAGSSGGSPAANSEEALYAEAWPKNTWAEKSRFVGKVGHLPREATTMEWVHAFAAMVAAVAPRMVIACDDTSQRLLQTLALMPPPGMRPEVHLQLAQLVQESLGDPAHYRTTTDKMLLASAAQSLGVRVPKFAIVSSVSEAQKFAASYGS